MNYAKLINGRIEYAPRTLTIHGQTIFNPTAEQYLSAGYLPVVTSDAPAKDGYAVDSEWEQVGSEIRQKWILRKDHSQMYESEVMEMFVRQNIQMLTVDDATAVRMRDFYPEWHDLIGTVAKTGMKFTYEGDLYEVNKAPHEHKFQADWVPGAGTESMYRLIPELYDGDEYDPIPYKGNIELEQGKYYTQDGVTYVCVRPSGIPVHDTLAQLETEAGGHYVEIVIV